MPGIFGFMGQGTFSDAEQRLRMGAAAINPSGQGEIRSIASGSYGLAVCMRKRGLPGADLWMSADKELLIAIDGEIYGPAPGTPEDIIAFFPDRPESRPGSLIGKLYAVCGDKWVEYAEGAFSAVIIDTRKDRCSLFTDRFGFRPISYTTTNAVLIFSTVLAGFSKAWPEKSWSQNLQALSDWVTFEHILGEKTHLEGVSLMPNAGRLAFSPQKDTLEIEEYWSLARVQPLTDITFEEAVEHAGHLFQRAMARLVADTPRAGLYLTSGLDSRAIGGVLQSLQPGFASVTYGLPGCRDMVWGADLAKIFGSEHHPFPMEDGAWIFDHAARFVSRTESFVNVLHSHGVHTYEPASEFMDVHLSGYGGGSFYGGDTTSHEALVTPTETLRREALYHTYVGSLGNVFRSPMQRYALFSESKRKEVTMLGEKSFADEFDRYTHLRADIIGDAFTLGNRYKKMFAYLIGAEREFIEDRSPFMNYALIEFLFAIPAELRIERKMQLAYLDYFHPETHQVPWQVSGLPPSLKKEHVEGYKAPSGPIPFEPGRNYPLWMYENGLGWASQLLDNDRIEGRGIFDREYLRELIARFDWTMKTKSYQEQRNLAYRVGSVASFELMCRLVIDGDSVQ